MRARIMAAAAAGLALGGCVVVAGNEGLDEQTFGGDRGGVVGGDTASGLERLYSAAVEPGGLRVRVASNGCTSTDSFDVDVDRVTGAGGAPRRRVSLRRENPDRCRALVPDGVELFFSRGRLGVGAADVILVANPVQR